MSLTRREFLGALGAAAVFAAGPSGRRVGAAARLGPSGETFTEPRVLTSAGGRLEVELVAAPTQVPFGAGTRFAYTYGGTTPGPTLRVRPGDVLSITLRNRLGETTNLHTHGLHVSPSGNADNVFVSVPDGEQRTYTYRIPADHRSGLFWYHPHHHELVARQLFGGLVGAIVVEDAIDALPALIAATERVLVLNDANVGDSADVLDVSMMERMLGREGDTVLLNGVEAPTITAQAGSLEHWRILNASTSRYYRLALEGNVLHLIGTDGGRLASPVAVEELLLAPGERVEVLVTPSTPGRARLRSLPYDRGRLGMGGGGPSAPSARVLVANLDVSGDAPPAAVPSALASPASLALPVATAEREVAFEMGMGGPRGAGGGMGGGSGGGMGARFTIDGKSFDAARTDITTRLDRVEDWTLTNTSPMDHPFHLHVWPFQVVARSDGAPIGAGWKDTVNLPAGESVTVRIPFTQIRGRTVYHCHILDHEDLGMMGVIRVRAGAPL